MQIKYGHSSKSWVRGVQITSEAYASSLCEESRGLNLESSPTCFLLFVPHEGKVETKVFSILAVGRSLFDLGRSARPRKDPHWERVDCLMLECDTHE